MSDQQPTTGAVSATDRDRAVPPTPAELFGLTWDALADVLGTAATSTLVRRAIRHAMPRAPELAHVEVARDGLAYRYRLPPAWSEHGPGREAQGAPQQALRELVRELVPLLLDLTGPVVVRRLARLTALQQCGIVSAEELTRWS